MAARMTLTVVPISATQINVSVGVEEWDWANGYRIMRGDGANPSYTKQIYTGTTPGHVYHDTGLTPGATYTYEVIGEENGIGHTVLDSKTITTPLPVPSLSLSGATNTSINLSFSLSDWSIIPDGQLQIYRGTDGVDFPKGFAFKKNGNYTDSGLSPNTTYYYRARSYYNGSVSAWSDVKSATTTNYISPSKPSITATLVGDNSVSIQGSVSSFGTPSTGTLSITVKKDSGAAQTLASTSSKSIAYTHEGLAEGSTYVYTVVASNGKASSESSDAKTFTIAVLGRMRVKVGNEWKQGVPYVRQNGTWVKGQAYVRANGAWQKGK